MSEVSGILEAMRAARPVFWKNEGKPPAEKALSRLPVGMADILEAEARLARFAPFIRTVFPETGQGLIESPLVPVPSAREAIEKAYGKSIPGSLWIKADSELPVAGSIKARGGIHEVLKVAEGIALEEGLLKEGSDTSCLASSRAREIFSRREIAVGSTGNLGMSIGIMAAALGFRATVTMSRDAKAWKKTLLRSRGVRVVEVESDYSEAVAEGRRKCEADGACHFVDDERSLDLFMGYAVAALRLKRQLEEAGVVTDSAHPLSVTLPCGVGGAPGGITFGLKSVFGDAVKCWFVEPTKACCMTLAFVRNTPEVSVKDLGLDGPTEADGLAVGVPSALVWGLVKDLVDGALTVEDPDLFRLLALLRDSTGRRAEPSAASALMGPLVTGGTPGTTHVAWLTGGLFLPEEVFGEMLSRGRALLKS
jgi:D-serine dehydratase